MNRWIETARFLWRCTTGRYDAEWLDTEPERVRAMWHRGPIPCPRCRELGYVAPHDGQHVISDRLPPSKPHAPPPPPRRG